MDILILTILIILCISEFFTIYLIVNYLGVHITFDGKNKDHTPSAVQEPVTPTPEEEERMRLMRERSRAELEAFQELMNYNPSIAYGLTKKDDGQ